VPHLHPRACALRSRQIALQSLTPWWIGTVRCSILHSRNLLADVDPSPLRPSRHSVYRSVPRRVRSPLTVTIIVFTELIWEPLPACAEAPPTPWGRELSKQLLGSGAGPGTMSPVSGAQTPAGQKAITPRWHQISPSRRRNARIPDTPCRGGPSADRYLRQIQASTCPQQGGHSPLSARQGSPSTRRCRRKTPTWRFADIKRLGGCHCPAQRFMRRTAFAIRFRLQQLKQNCPFLLPRSGGQ